MSIDLPHVEYAKDKNRKPTKADYDEAMKATMELREKYKNNPEAANIGNNYEQIDLSDLMKNSNKQ